MNTNCIPALKPDQPCEEKYESDSDEGESLSSVEDNEGHEGGEDTDIADAEEEDESSADEANHPLDSRLSIISRNDSGSSDDSGSGDEDESEALFSDDAKSGNELNDGNSGWADAMQKVLSMGINSTKPVTVLSKAKKDNIGRKKVPKDSVDESERRKSDSASDEEPEATHIPVSVLRAKKREIDTICRVKPDILQKTRERGLVKVATRGVVQLFNAVREQQKNVRQKLKEAGNSRQREKVLKNLDKKGFLAVLDGKRPNAGDEPIRKKAKVELKEEDAINDSTWSALKEDYMLGAKMKDWDKDSDPE